MPLTSLYTNKRSLYGLPPIRRLCQASLDEVERRGGREGLRTLERMLQARLHPVGADLDAGHNNAVRTRIRETPAVGA